MTSIRAFLMETPNSLRCCQACIRIGTFSYFAELLDIIHSVDEGQEKKDPTLASEASKQRTDTLTKIPAKNLSKDRLVC